MTANLMLALVAYEIVDDRARAQVARVLEERLMRVQDSLFEGWLPRHAAEQLARRAAAHIAPSDSLRLYVLRGQDSAKARAWGFPPAPEQNDYLMF